MHIRVASERDMVSRLLRLLVARFEARRHVGDFLHPDLDLDALRYPAAVPSHLYLCFLLTRVVVASAALDYCKYIPI
jgi:hypothetical protein